MKLEEPSQKTTDDPSENRLISHGPQRDYLASDILWKNRIGEISYWDVLLALVIAIGYGGLLFNHKLASFTQGHLDNDELQLWDARSYYKQGKYALSPLGAFGIQFYSLIPSCKPLLRIVSLAFACFTLGNLYLGQRRVGVSPIVGFVSICAIGYLPLFQLRSSQISVASLQWYLLSLVFYSWQSFTYYPLLSFPWVFHLLLLSISLGLSIATKYLGFITWIWIFAIALLHFWNTIGDIKLGSSVIAKCTIIQILILSLIPTAIFITSNDVMLNHWTQDSPEFSTYMSSNFKSFLRGPLRRPTGITYGSIITLRHMESLGGYLHSHNRTYETGSFEQQVALSQQENDPNNQWILEYKFVQDQNIMINKKIHDGDDIRLRHRMTGKLLRTSDARPPVSGEDYDNEVSGTGDWSYGGDSDELWKIHIVNSPRHSVLKPIESIVKLENEGHECKLISHDTKLPNTNQQEVLCVEDATESRTHFYFETSEPVIPEDEEYELFYCKRGKLRCTADLLIEFWQRQFKYNSYQKNSNVINPYPPETWPFNLFGNKLSNSVWISGIVFPVAFFFYELIQFFSWNPYNPTLETTINSLILNKVGIECVLGWFMHYYCFLETPHLNVDATLYIPALLLGLLVVFQVINFFYNRNHWFYLSLIIVYCIIMFYI